MRRWTMKEVENAAEAQRLTRCNRKNALLQNSNGLAHVVYVFQEDGRGIIVEEYDSGVKPAVVEMDGKIFAGTNFGIYCFDADLNEIKCIPLCAPFYEFISSKERQLVIAACEIDLYCLNAACDVVWHKLLSDILSGWHLAGDVLTYSLFEGGTLAVNINTAQSSQAV